MTQHPKSMLPESRGLGVSVERGAEVGCCQGEFSIQDIEDVLSISRSISVTVICVCALENPYQPSFPPVAGCDVLRGKEDEDLGGTQDILFSISMLLYILV